MIIFRLLFFVGMFSSTLAYFEEYHARNAYVNGENASAQKLYDELLTRQPDDASAAYNCGKIALKEKEFQKAEAYFNHVTQNAAAPNSLREQAWYDAGLSFVHRELWHDALSSFEEVLKLNPDNEYAKKMIEQIQKKLDEQKQQQEQQQQDEQSSDESDEKKDDNNDSQKNDQNDSQPESDTNKNKDDQKNSDDQKSDEQSQNSDNEEQNKDEHSNDRNNAPQQQNKNNQEEQQQSGQPQPQQAQKQESSPGDQNKKAPIPQQAGEQKELPDTKKAGTYGNQKPQDKESKLLELVEQHDAQASKALFKRHIQQQMPSYYGQKNW